MNTDGNHPIKVLRDLSYTLNLEEIQELGRLINHITGNEKTEKLTTTCNKPCDSSENSKTRNTDWTYQYITEEELARKYKMSTKKLRSLRQNNEISYHRMGKQIRYSPSDVEEFDRKSHVAAKKKPGL